MRAHYRAGRRAEALRAYETCRRRLAEAMGVQPGPETQALFTSLLQTEPEPEGSPGELTRAVATVVSLLEQAGRPRGSGPEGGPPGDDARLIVDLLRRAGVRVPPPRRALGPAGPRTPVEVRQPPSPGSGRARA